MRYIKSRANTGPPGAGEINHEADNRKDVRLQHKSKIIKTKGFKNNEHNN